MSRTSPGRLLRSLLLAVVSLGGTAAFAAIPPHVVEVLPKDGAAGVPIDGVIKVVGSGTWREGDWVKLVLIEDEAGKEVPLNRGSAQWGKHSPDPKQPPGHVGGGTYTDTVLTFKPASPLKPRTRYLVRYWDPLHSRAEKPIEVRFTTGAGPAKEPTSPARR